MELLAMTQVNRITADQCQLGQETDAGEPLKKPTGFMTNSAMISEELEKNAKCDKTHEHHVLIGNLARQAAEYPPRLVDAILRVYAANSKEQDDFKL